MKHNCKCGETKADKFYPSNPYCCRACFKKDSQRRYKRRAKKMKADYAANRDKRLEYQRELYRKNKPSVLLKSRLRYRLNKDHPTAEDQFIIEELTAIIDGAKPMPDHCDWCGSTSHLNPHCPEADSRAVRWLCLHCRRTLVADNAKAKRRKPAGDAKKPQLPRWLRRIVGRRKSRGR